MKRHISKALAGIVGIFSLIISGSAQNIGIGQWQIHLPYNSCISAAGDNGTMYAASENGLFAVNRADNSIERINKVNGLSDITIKAINWNNYTHELFVGYKNANIDIIKGKTITNIPDIKNAQIIGNKTINGAYFIGNLAYVACGFGIVVVDMDRKEIKDTYYIGPNGSYLEVYEITSDGNMLYAGTDAGVYYASLSNPNLANFTSWSKFSGIPNGPYNHLVMFNGRLMANFSKRLQSNAYEDDTLFCYRVATATWDTFPAFAAGTHEMNGMSATNEKIYIGLNYNVFIYDTTIFNPSLPVALDNIYTYNGNGPNVNPWPKDIFVDEGKRLWVADKRNGLVRIDNVFNGTIFYPNGPGSPNVYSMTLRENNLLVAAGNKNDAWGNTFNIDGVFNYRNNSWSTFNRVLNPGFDTLWDILGTAIDPTDVNHYFFACWGKGLVEFRNGNISAVYNTTNSSLVSNQTGQWVGVGGLDYDEDNNLWMTNSNAINCLSVRKADNSWQSFNFTGYVTSGTTVGNVIVTKNKQKWIILPRGSGLLVFDENGTISNTSDDRKKKLGFTPGAGNISGTDVLCIAEDQDGEIWVGTDKGICVFYSPENVFNSSGFDAQQILIDYGGYVQILLETQVVTAIAVDGANRKWIGTESGGVFLMSEDGTKQLLHFDVENSPLLSNTITSIAINSKTGEVFFGTDKGIVSYRSDATEGGDTNGEVYAFPNPVTPEYDGPIAITGLVRDADVKITDIRGQVVYQTKALGGQATWNGNNFSGQRAASGVYLVFITNEDGTETAITKILFIN